MSGYARKVRRSTLLYARALGCSHCRCSSRGQLSPSSALRLGGFVRYRRREKNGGQQSQATPCLPKSAEPQTIAFSQRVTCTIDEACEATGLERTKLYELIGAGHLATTTVGRRRLVAVQSLLSLLKASMST
ncbi:helix-turn-helix domain-containing protein [Tardiphaga sp. 709]|uniref:helix-turn-helix domain-containing protein n=1 Tax=Tardiphaga sp. 709 TaxID=3076039 RepID=UPI00396576B9